MMMGTVSVRLADDLRLLFERLRDRVLLHHSFACSSEFVCGEEQRRLLELPSARLTELVCSWGLELIEKRDGFDSSLGV